MQKKYKLILAFLAICAGLIGVCMYETPLQSIACNSDFGVCSVYVQKKRFSEKIVENTFDIKNISHYSLEKRSSSDVKNKLCLNSSYKLILYINDPEKTVEFYTFNINSKEQADNFVNQIRSTKDFRRHTTLVDAIKGLFLRG